MHPRARQTFGPGEFPRKKESQLPNPMIQWRAPLPQINFSIILRFHTALKSLRAPSAVYFFGVKKTLAPVLTDYEVSAAPP
jgi:hypothetical protein